MLAGNLELQRAAFRSFFGLNAFQIFSCFHFSTTAGQISRLQPAPELSPPLLALLNAYKRRRNFRTSWNARVHGGRDAFHSYGNTRIQHDIMNVSTISARTPFVSYNPLDPLRIRIPAVRTHFVQLPSFQMWYSSWNGFWTPFHLELVNSKAERIKVFTSIFMTAERLNRLCRIHN